MPLKSFLRLVAPNFDTVTEGTSTLVLLEDEELQSQVVKAAPIFAAAYQEAGWSLQGIRLPDAEDFVFPLYTIAIKCIEDRRRKESSVEIERSGRIEVHCNKSYGRYPAVESVTFRIAFND